MPTYRSQSKFRTAAVNSLREPNTNSIVFRPEVKEGKEGETEKKAEQENNESDKIEKELEKDKVTSIAHRQHRFELILSNECLIAFAGRREGEGEDRGEQGEGGS